MQEGLGMKLIGMIFVAALLVPTKARAECSPPTPACHLASGKKLLKTDPKAAAADFLASFKLDEKTDTLILYAQALEADKQWALAAETWKRVATYRDSELTAVKEKKGNTAAAKKNLDAA